MKKNISINLQGMIFHIEEDGYEQLSQYLAAIKTYFSGYEGHEEITADIEARMAEIFYAKLTASKQVITREDVEALIAQMGSVKDFQTLEEEDVEHKAKSSGYGETFEGFNTQKDKTGNPYTNTGNTGHCRIYRDENRKVIGGVAAGIANYMSVDPLWIRLGFIFLGILFAIPGGFPAGLIIIGYLLCWIAFPKSYALPETPSKKLFRNPFDKKLGGVASGFALFFGMDVAVIRLLFLISFFIGGFGLLAYLVLWIIVPEASSITDRVQMEGNPVTLSGIEESLKNNLRMKDENGQENDLAKIILFPVRVIAQVLQFLSRILGPLLNVLVAVIRILAGSLLMLVSGTFIFALFVMAFTALNIIDGSSIVDFGDIPFSMFVNSFPVYGLVAGFFAALIPALILLILGLGLLIKRFYLRPAVGWSLFAIWIVSLFALILSIIDFRNNFRESGEHVTQKTFPVANYGTIVLDAHETGSFRNGKANFEIEGYGGTDVRLIQEFRAKGLSEQEAIKNAKLVTYRSSQKDSILTFDYNFKFNQKAVYREQELNLKLLIPENKKVRLSEDMIRWLPNEVFDFDFSEPFTFEDWAKRTWQVKNNKFTCLDCLPADTTNSEPTNFSENNNDEDNILSSPLLDENEYGDERKSFNYQNFERINVSGAYHVKIRKGNSYSVQAQGEGEMFRNLEIEQNGNELEIGMRENMLRFSFRDTEPVLIMITMPDLKEMDVSGAVKVDAAGFNSDQFTYSASGAVESVLNISGREVKIDATGACSTQIAGHGETITISGTGASEIKANKFTAQNAFVDLSGACSARVYATSRLKAEVSGPSNISYSGNPVVEKNNSGIGSIERED